jgi:hypothetical protein
VVTTSSGVLLVAWARLSRARPLGVLLRWLRGTAAGRLRSVRPRFRGYESSRSRAERVQLVLLEVPPSPSQTQPSPFKCSVGLTLLERASFSSTSVTCL